MVKYVEHTVMYYKNKGDDAYQALLVLCNMPVHVMFPLPTELLYKTAADYE